MAFGLRFHYLENLPIELLNLRKNYIQEYDHVVAIMVCASLQSHIEMQKLL